MNYHTTQFWYILEQLVPFDLTKTIKDLKHFGFISETDNDAILPWQNPDILTSKFKLPLGFDKKGNLIQYNYRVYLAVFPLELVFDFLQSLPLPVTFSFTELASNTKNLSCFASIKIDHNGLLIDESLSCSSIPWALTKVQSAFTSKKRLDLDGWTKDYHNHTSNLGQLFSSYVKAQAEAQAKMSVNTLSQLIQDLFLTQSQWRPDKFSYLGCYTVERSSKTNETSKDIINSFYLEDLEAASGNLQNNTASKPLRQYLAEGLPHKIPVEERSFLQQWLSPEYLPYGRWPTDPTHNLALMQQCAVNLAVNQLDKTGGIFSVNGPPGTGKTTLLRDLIADLITQRAERLVKYKNPADAFISRGRIYCPEQAVTGFELIVASSNNGAVENVTAELPSLEAIASQYQEQATYLRKTAQSVKESGQGKSQEKFNQPGNKTIQQPVGELEEESLDSLISERSNQPVWGLIAAVLGNKTNCNRFCDGFWFDRVDSIRLLLKEDNSLYEWQVACERFEQRKQKVTELIEQRQSYANLVRKQAELSVEYEQAKANLSQKQKFFLYDQQMCNQAQEDLWDATRLMNEYYRYIDRIRLSKPSFFARLFKRAKFRQYQQRLNTAQQKVEGLREQALHLKTRLEKSESDYQQAERLHQEAKADFKRKEQELESINLALARIKKHSGLACVDSAWWQRPHEEFQLSTPWVDQVLNEARTQLFLSALKVHEQFIHNASRPLMKNLSAWVELVKGKGADLSASQVLHLWQTFFLVVPVVSTTFASIQRLFKRLPLESLGWLLIDEAGQGTPQAAVGALQRAKRVVVVGDPLQIKPVFTLDPAVVEGLRLYFGIDEHWSPNQTSIQALCDRVNPYGTMIETETEPLWIGCPLWVHRRCIEPMVAIANTIAYNGKMVMATKLQKEQHFPLEASCWIDIGGACQGRHWVPEQGEEVVQMLRRILKTEKSLPSLYIISPFRSISFEMQNLLRQKKNEWAKKIPDVENWLKRSVGTVHTFQGKEADAVILLLGTDEKSQGAAQWAASEPNILNVAATRAKYRFYIVGSKLLWARLKYFETASNLLAPK